MSEGSLTKIERRISVENGKHLEQISAELRRQSDDLVKKTKEIEQANSPVAIKGFLGASKNSVRDSVEGVFEHFTKTESFLCSALRATNDNVSKALQLMIGTIALEKDLYDIAYASSYTHEQFSEKISKWCETQNVKDKQFKEILEKSVDKVLLLKSQLDSLREEFYEAIRKLNIPQNTESLFQAVSKIEEIQLGLSSIDKRIIAQSESDKRRFQEYEQHFETVVSNLQEQISSELTSRAKVIEVKFQDFSVALERQAHQITEVGSEISRESEERGRELAKVNERITEATQTTEQQFNQISEKIVSGHKQIATKLEELDSTIIQGQKQIELVNSGLNEESEIRAKNESAILSKIETNIEQVESKFSVVEQGFNEVRAYEENTDIRIGNVERRNQKFYNTVYYKLTIGILALSAFVGAILSIIGII